MRNTLQVLGRLTLVLAIVLAGGFGLTAQSAAAQTQFPGYTAGVQIANLTATSAIVSLTAYNSSDGNQNGSPLNDTIPGNSSKTYFLNGDIIGFSGSMSSLAATRMSPAS